MSSSSAGDPPSTPPPIGGTQGGGKRPLDLNIHSPERRRKSHVSPRGENTLLPPVSPAIRGGSTPKRRKRPTDDNGVPIDIDDPFSAEEEGETTPTRTTPGPLPWGLAPLTDSPQSPNSPANNFMLAALRAELTELITKASGITRQYLELTRLPQVEDPNIRSLASQLHQLIIGQPTPDQTASSNVLKAIQSIAERVEFLSERVTHLTTPNQARGLEASIHNPNGPRTFAQVAAPSQPNPTTPSEPTTLPRSQPPVRHVNPNRAHDPTRLIIAFNGQIPEDQRTDEAATVDNINRHLRANGAPEHLIITAIKWNKQGNCIAVTRSDQTAAEILPFCDNLTNAIIPGSSGTVREDKKWYKIEIGNVRTGAKDGDGEGVYSTETIHQHLMARNPEYSALAKHIVMKPRWIRPENEITHKGYSSVIFATDSFEHHQAFLKNTKFLAAFGRLAKIREWTERPPIIQCQRCWEFGHRTSVCSLSSVRCRICSEDHPEDQHPHQADADMELDEYDPSETPNQHKGTCINCKKANRTNTNHPSNWTRCPERRLLIGNNREESTSKGKTQSEWTTITKKSRTTKKAKAPTTPAATQNPQNGSLESPNPFAAISPHPPSIQKVTELAKTLGVDVSSPDAIERIRNAFTDALNKYGTHQ